MAMEWVFTWLAIFIWVSLGAVIALAFWMVVERKRLKAQPDYAPFAELLGKPCWMNEHGEYEKFRIVAVSHKGAVAIRRWDDYSGKHARWFDREKLRRGSIYLEDPEKGFRE